MIRDRGLKVKKFMLNGRIGWLYGEKSPANGIRKSHDFKAFLTISLDLRQIPNRVSRMFFPSEWQSRNVVILSRAIACGH